MFGWLKQKWSSTPEAWPVVPEAPTLIGISETDFGSLLESDDGSVLPINITPSRLDRAFIEYHVAPLAELLARRSVRVYSIPWTMTASDWDRIREIVYASSVARAALQDFPSEWDLFARPVAVLRELPQRVYGGLSETAVYPRYPCQFQPHWNRKAPWRYEFLNAPGGWVFPTSVHLDRGEVECHGEIIPGHFID